MAGLRCIKPGCGFESLAPENQKGRLMLPSATVTCPKCRLKQPAADAFLCFEARQAELRRGLTVSNPGLTLRLGAPIVRPRGPGNG